jgi:hypothetical protein
MDKLSCMSNLARADRPDMVVLQDDDRCGLAVERDKLNLIGLAVSIKMHDGSYVPGAEALGRNVTILEQCDHVR